MYFDYSSPPPHNSSQAHPTTLHPPNSLSSSFLWLTKFNLYYPCAHGCRGIHWSVVRPPGATYWKRTDSPPFGHLLSVTSSPVRGLELVSSSQPPPPSSWNVEDLIYSACLLQAATVAETSWVPWSSHVQKKLFDSGPPWPLAPTPLLCHYHPQWSMSLGGGQNKIDVPCVAEGATPILWAKFEFLC